MTIELPQEILPLFPKRDKALSGRVKELTIVELFREGKLSSGKAAEILGMKRREFIAHLSRQGIPYYDMDKDELARDVSVALRQAK